MRVGFGTWRKLGDVDNFQTHPCAGFCRVKVRLTYHQGPRGPELCLTGV